MLYAFIGFKLLFLTRVINLIDKWNDFRMLDLHAERIADIALAEPRSVEARCCLARRDAGPLTIEAKDLGFAYGPEGFVFRGVNLTVAPGETVAIVGPSGCGKTTLIKVLLGLLPPTEGEVRVNGRDLADWDAAQYRSPRRRGDAGRSALRRHDRGQHQLLRHRSMIPQRVRECARAAMIDEEIMAMPMQYNTIVGSLGMALSGGQKQRVLLARALYRKPQVLFLDEAFDQLDVALERRISSGIASSAISLIIVSHRPDTIESSIKRLFLESNASDQRGVPSPLSR